MPTLNHRRRFCLLIGWMCAATFCAAQQSLDLPTSLPLRQVLVGEDAALNIQSQQGAAGPLQAEQTNGLTLRDLGTDILRGYGQAFNIGVSANTPGSYEIPIFEIPLPSTTGKSTPQQLEVFGTENIEWQILQNGEESYRIGSILLHPTGTIYAGQSIPLTGKILLPVELPVSSTGYAELEKGNIGAWRMESPTPPNYDRSVSPRPPNANRLREVRIDGKRYQVINYVTFAAPLAPGEVTVGPAEVKGLQILAPDQQTRRGLFSQFPRSYNLDYTIPAATFTAKALPAGAPATFEGAIGDFELIASLDISNELKAGDPVVVQLEVSGNGNLDILKAPRLMASEANWKIYPPSRNEQEGDRRSNQGTVVFSQILRPLTPTEEIPPFEFTFFNIGEGKYETLRSNTMPLNLVIGGETEASAPPQAGLVPIPEMKDILSIIPPQDFRPKSSLRITPWWQLIPALAAALLVFLIAKKHLPKIIQKNPHKEQLQRDLAEVEKSPDDLTFLRKAAALAEREELPHDDFLVALLAERDASCFQPDGEQLTLKPERRREILTTLRTQATRLLLLSGILLSFLGGEARASLQEAEQAWEEGNYEAALASYQALAAEKASPDLLYNIGNCYYRLEQPAEAALSYHRALRLDPEHPEASQNLAFLNRKLGALVAPALQTPAWAQRLPLTAVFFALQLSLWLIGLGVLARFALVSSRGRVAALSALILGCVILSASALAYVFYPKTETAQAAPDALISSSKAEAVRTEPSAGGSVIVNATPTTTSLIITRRGPWSYIELPDSTRGWIRSEALSEI